MNIIVLPGDGIGPEVTAEAVACLAFLSEARGLGLTFEEHDFGGIAIDRHGSPLPPAMPAEWRAVLGGITSAFDSEVQIA